MTLNQPTYTDTQVEAYLKRIAYTPTASDANTLVEDVRQRVQSDALGTLSELQRRHLAAVPWGNSALHYSQHHTISLHPDSLHEKIVERRLDGYCMESTGIFLIVLRSLGYHVYATGGRVSHAAATGVDNGLYLSLSHMVLIAIIGGAKYMVDVGFGNNCATAPLPLQEGATATCIAPSEMRLIKETLVEFTDKSQKVWIFQTRHNPESPWLPNIAFSEAEFLPQDFRGMNFSVSQEPSSWFTQTFVCMRMILDPTGKEIVGQCIMSGKEVKRRIKGQTEVLQVLKNEEDRVKALAKYFDMHLRESEAEGIRGLTSQLK
ncbi:putative N-acetyltransferase family protein [Penicillium brasilianum]|uniref:Putative N-acetyltransferase family protein n=1 Tax=Penicillium brasilianum TaxID=104259 RepID=A0A1S9RYE4_PENBI|nr:putative N-acetyltransferase family protein [Penicillium brasilianum]